MKSKLFLLSIMALLFSCKKECIDPTPPTTSTLKEGLVAHYHFSGNANDATINKNDGVAIGASLTADRFGNENEAYVFNGVGNYIKINNSPSLDLKESFSISVWIRPNNYLNPGIIVWHGAAASGQDPFILYFSNGAGYNGLGVRKDCGTGLNVNEVYAPSNVIFSNIWSHVTGVCNSVTKQMKIYINGELLKTASFSDLSFTYSTANFYTMLGAVESTAGLSGFFNGKMDEVRIYNRELIQKEISELSKL
ncbi:LamG domain-containing protein [Ferruginibacter sp.]